MCLQFTCICALSALLWFECRGREEEKEVKEEKEEKQEGERKKKADLSKLPSTTVCPEGLKEREENSFTFSSEL